MDQELERLSQAILIASNPAQVTLHQQALEYLSTVLKNAATTWRLALSLFIDVGSDGSRRHSPQVRFYALRILDEFLDNRFDPLNEDSFRTLQQSFVSYIQSEYVYGQAEAYAPFLRNKFSHTLTLLFLSSYMDQWTTFFVDLFTLISPSESSSHPIYNRHVSLLFFHLVLEISGEVADQVIKSARPHNAVRQTRDAHVRDAVRERDAARINEAVLTIVTNGVERMSALRKVDGVASERELDDVVEIVDWGIRTFASYVGWIDINLTVTPTTIPLLFSLLSDPSLPIRLATSVALLRILSKGLKEPEDKLQLVKVLSLGPVIDALETKTRVQQSERGSDTDEGEESYREALGKLLNVLGLELIKLGDDGVEETVRAEANRLLNEILPVMLRFMSDEYDDTCSTVFPLLQSVLGSYKRSRKMSSDPIDDSKRSFLTSLLEVIIGKMKWDEDADPDDMDDDDRAAFDGLRKDLRSFLDAVLVIDQDLVTNAVQALALSRLSAYQNGSPLKWHEAELAIYLVYIFGEINKSGGKGRAAFCHAPAVPKEERKATDYSDYPLTNHGEMMLALVRSGISSYPHQTVSMQFFETVARYGDFFKVRKECIMPTLQAMIDPRGLHSNSSSVRARVYYLFHRFIKECRNEMSAGLAATLVNNIRDTLTIEVELPDLENPDQQDIFTEAVDNPGLFDSQLYLFETVGVLVSLLFRNPEVQSSLLLSVVNPLLEELSSSLQAVKSQQDVIPILKIHHIMMALGNIAKGFPEYPSPVPPGYHLPPLDVFGQIVRAILASLEAMNVFKVVRDATRFAFARILAPTGPNITHFIPPLMANLITHFEPSELVDFMNFIGLLIHKLQLDIFDVLDELIGPLSSHVTQVMEQPVTGTDDQMAHVDTKKAYLSLLNNIMAAKLQGIFLSQRNKAGIEPLLASMQSLAEDVTDPVSEKAAFVFLGRCVSAWGQSASSSSEPNGRNEVQGLPGFEQFIYQRLVPTAFRVLSFPEFNPKDGQITMVIAEIANFLQIICKTRQDEALNFFVSVFLPSQNWPPDTAVEFTTKMRVMDIKTFRKYFTDFVRSSRAS